MKSKLFGPATIAALATMGMGSLPAMAQSPIKVGFVSTFSGPQAAIGEDMRRSVELAKEHLGGKMGGKFEFMGNAPITDGIALRVVGFYKRDAGYIDNVPGTRSFLPEEDQSSFMAEIQLPDAASTSRTLEAVTEVEAMLTGQPWLQNFFTVSGTSLLDGLNLPNRAMMIVSLKSAPAWRFGQT